MIVISRDLVLPGAASNNPIIGFDNVVRAQTVSADFEDQNFPASNLANPSTALKWLGLPDTANQHATISGLPLSEIDYLAVARHNFGTQTIAVKVEGDTGGGFVEVSPEILPADDRPILFRFQPQILSAIRLRMAPGEGAPSAAVIYVGKLLILQRRIYVGHTPIPFGRQTRITNGRSESGNFLGRIVLGESRRTSVVLQNLTPAFYRNEMEPFIEVAQEIPFFFGWRPGSFPTEIGYAWLTSDPRPSNQRSNGMMQIELQLAGIT